MPLIHHVPTPGIGHVGHLVADLASRRALVVDPTRDIEPYVELARRHDLEITWVLDTHAHNDYLSGVRALVERTGAVAIAPIGLSTGYEAELGWHRRVIELGPDVRVQLVHTPGHTPEHTAVVVSGVAELPVLLSGGSLLIGDVGRPDLLGDERQWSHAADASRHSVLEVLAPLPDDALLAPTHVGGSPCAGGLEEGTSSTLGEQRAGNRAVRAMLAGEPWFDARMAPPVPRYWSTVRRANVAGVPRAALGTAPKRVDAEVLRHASSLVAGSLNDVLLLDVRELDPDVASHPRAVHVPPGAAFAMWAGIVAHGHDRVVLVADDEHQARAASDQLLLVRERAVDGWVDARELLGEAPLDDPGEVATVADWYVAPEELDWTDRVLVDVRAPSEVRARPYDADVEVPAQGLLADPALRPEGRLVIACAAGYRAAIVASLLRRDGIDAVAIDGAPTPSLASLGGVA